MALFEPYAGESWITIITEVCVQMCLCLHRHQPALFVASDKPKKVKLEAAVVFLNTYMRQVSGSGYDAGHVHGIF